MERLYTDIDGRQLKKGEYNTHHPFFRWTAKGKGGVFRSFIDHMTVPMTIEPHKALHAELEAPLLPSLTLIHRIRSYTSGLPDNNPYNRIISVTEFLEETAERCPNSDHRRQAEQIVPNLQQQLPFILLGQVLITPIQEAA
jgi:hypothetical protein